MEPEVVGLTLGETRKRLKDQGVAIESIDVTAPPRQKSSEYDDFYRVIRMELVDANRAKLLVCKPL